MLEWISDYGLFLAKGLTVAFLFAMVVMVLSRARREGGPGLETGHLQVETLNDHYRAEADALRSLVWDDASWKAERKTRKAQVKAERKQAKAGASAQAARARVFVLQFHGDLAATAVTHLRHEISALLAVAEAGRDEVVVLLESPGGMVHSYGLAASQLARIRDAGLQLTVCVDKVAASGGYLMACIGNQVLAAPFAIIGSIGVVAQIPNIHRLLKKNSIDIELMTAGEYKRTLTMLGENTDAGREKFQHDLDETHDLFKGFVQQWRPQVDIARVGTGEHWYGKQAIDLQLVDVLRTSDDYLRARAREADLFGLHWRTRKTLSQRLGLVAEEASDRLLMRWWQRGLNGPRF